MKVAYHAYSIGAAEEAAVVAALRSGWLTAGAKVAAFEAAFVQYRCAHSAAQAAPSAHAVGVASCTAALTTILAALQLPAGAEVLTTPMTFAATANAIIHAGLKPAFVDIDPATLNIDPARLAERLTPHTAAVVVVHYAGNACDMAAILHAASSRPVIEDCAHAIETEYQGVAAGLLGVAGAFSFYPNKNITTGEGGLVLTSDAALAERVRRLRLHGLNRSTYDRAQTPQLSQYDITDAGYKANMNEIQAAIGLCQLQNVAAWHARRCWIAAQYSAALEPTGLLAVVKPIANTVPAWHLFTVQLHLERLSASRDAIAAAIISRGIGLTVAYQPLHTFSYYRRVWGTHVGDFPVAEAAYPRLLSLPIYPALTDEQVYYVCETVRDVLLHHKR